MARPGRGAGEKPRNPSMQFVLDYLRRKPQAPYSEVASAAQARGLQMWPILYGRAQAMHGIVKSRPRGTGQAGRAATPSRGGAGGAGPEAPRRRGRPPKAGRPAMTRAPARSAATGDVDDVIHGLNSAMDELQRYRQALEQIAETAREAVSQ